MAIASAYGTAPKFGTSAYATTDVAAPTAADYASLLKTSLDPTFTQQTQSLEEQLEAQGILRSGAGSKQLQDLTGQQGATFASQLTPLLAQQEGEQFQASSQNAAAKNSAAGTGYSGALQTYLQGLNQSQSGAEFEQQLQQSGNEFNTAAQNQFALAQLGFGNADYLAQLQDIAGLYSSGLGATSSIYGNGVGQITNAGQSAATNAASAASGLGSGYGSSSPFNFGGGGGGSSLPGYSGAIDSTPLNFDTATSLTGDPSFYSGIGDVGAAAA